MIKKNYERLYSKDKFNTYGNDEGFNRKFKHY